MKSDTGNGEYLPFKIALVIRTVLLCYYIPCWIWDLCQQTPTWGDNENIYTDYLTNWGSTLLLIHLSVAFVHLILSYFGKKSEIFSTINLTLIAVTLTGNS